MTISEGAQNAMDAYIDKVVRDARADARRTALREAYDACGRQTQLASLVAGRPTDFEKGVMSCMAAIQAALGEKSE